MSISAKRDRGDTDDTAPLKWWAAGVALLFVVVILFVAFKGSGPLRGGTTTDGRITSVDVDGTGRHRTCSITGSFEVEAQTYVATSASSTSGLCDFEVGSTVTVSYRPNDPTENRIVTRWDDSTPWIIALVIGVLVVLVAVEQVRRYRKRVARGRNDANRSGAAPDDQVAVDGGTGSRGPVSPAPPTGTPLVVPPGWYLVADGQSYRWWDGQSWTAHQWAAPPGAQVADREGGNST